MTQEEKQLLLQDLYARLVYGVVVNAQYKDGEGWKTEDRKLLGLYTDGQVYVDCVYTNIENIKPYLRSMYTMTDEEVKEYLGMLNDIDKSGLMNHNFITKVVDWLDKKMFDHRGLIPKCLALEAPEGMYNIK